MQTTFCIWDATISLRLCGLTQGSNDIVAHVVLSSDLTRTAGRLGTAVAGVAKAVEYFNFHLKSPDAAMYLMICLELNLSLKMFGSVL